MSETKPIIRLKLVWVIWALFGLFFACRAYIQGGAAGDPVSFPSALLRAQVNAQLYFLATIPALYLAGRFRLGRGSWHLHLPLHALASVVFAGTVRALDAVFYLRFYDPAGAGGATPARVVSAVLEKFDEGVYVYWGVVFVAQAYAYSRQGGGELRDVPPEDRRPGEQLNALRVQAHFIFNTLNSIVVLLREDVDGAEAMLVSLSDFLRGMLSREQEVPLRRELAVLKSYLYLQGARFGEKMDVRAGVEPETAEALVPHLLLLPLAENAIEHGITRPPGTRRLEVNARREGDRLLIQLFNDCEGEAAKELPPGKGAGLADTRARLSRLYGPSHSFDARYPPGGGFLVDIGIPFRVPRQGGAAANERAPTGAEG